MYLGYYENFALGVSRKEAWYVYITDCEMADGRHCLIIDTVVLVLVLPW